MAFESGAFRSLGISLGGLAPLLDGEVASMQRPQVDGDRLTWSLPEGRAFLEVGLDGDALRLRFGVEGLAPDRPVDSIGLRFGTVTGGRLYLRNGYQSWDGSFFVAPGTPAGDGPPAKAPTLGFAMTALMPSQGEGALVLGFTRHDRFQSRFRFGGDADAMSIDVETLWDRIPHDGRIEAEPLVLIEGKEVEETLRTWSRLVAAESPLPPRLPDRRITGWCSWYNLYAAIDEAAILDHLAAARRFRDRSAVPLDIFLIDDGFTPEMGDWLDVKPQFPRGLAPLVADIEAAGFTPGLWIAPFLVGNRSHLFAQHPDWLVQDRDTAGPLVHSRFYGEFRWHKRSEEYHVLDVTHPDAEAYIRDVFRTWRGWGVGYFKTDFMLAGAEYGPDRARWHTPGLSRIAVWRRMAELIREEIGDALWLGCGCPLWASVGLVDAMRIGRDIGVSWAGDYSAESLLRDQLTRNHASGLLWQGDPDCVLLRDRFHELSDAQVESLARFAGLAGGVLMTSDNFDELSEARQELFADLLKLRVDRCSFPRLGSGDVVIVQQAEAGGKVLATLLFNPTGREQAPEGEAVLPPYGSRLTGKVG
jgi:alpha-galactosidase